MPSGGDTDSRMSFTTTARSSSGPAAVRKIKLRESTSSTVHPPASASGHAATDALIPGGARAYALATSMPRGGSCVVSGISIRKLTVVTMLDARSEEHTSELQSLMRISYAVFCLKKKTHKEVITNIKTHYAHKTQ